MAERNGSDGQSSRHTLPGSDLKHRRNLAAAGPHRQSNVKAEPLAASLSVDGAGDLVIAQHRDGALDLPPAAEMYDVAKRSAAVGTLSGLELCQLAIMSDEIGGIGKNRAIFNMNMVVHAWRSHSSRVERLFSRTSLSNWRIAVVNAAFTSFSGLAPRSRQWH